jgi:hypothetical protein
MDPEGDAVRYRVFVDGVELVDGKLGEDGTSDTCTGTLDLLHDREYSWTVQAFDAEAPSSSSEMAEPFAFTTIWDGESRVVLTDDLDDPDGWLPTSIGSGEWEWGNPVGTYYGGLISQPDDCVSGDCWFTGQNPIGDPWDAEVSGITVLESPKFDLRGAQSVTVGYQRHVRKSEPLQTGVRFYVELVVPDPSEPSGERVLIVEQLETPEETEDTNTWIPVTHAACGVPAVDGAKLRFVAEDLGTGVLEAAIDDVIVTAWIGTDVCAAGPGAVCDPDTPEAACGTDLLCCASGTVNKGLYRCAEPVRAIDSASPGAAPPGNGIYTGELGCPLPDLRPSDALTNVSVEDGFFSANACAWIEGCIDEPGSRRLLRFDTTLLNEGASDLVLGLASNHPDLMEFSPCHGHYHLEGFAEYTLLDAADEIAAQGHKQAFCLLDFESWAWPQLLGYPDGGGDATYTCQNQGIGVGWEDTYGAALECQWIDVTGVPPGDYTLRVEINLPNSPGGPRVLNERDDTNNVREWTVTIP